jgi:hypothetical protein
MVKGNFARFDTCNREFHKISQTFGMRAELLQIQSTVNHEVSPDVRRALPDQTFDTYKDTKQAQIHPSDPTKTMSVAASLDAAEEKSTPRVPPGVLGNVCLASGGHARRTQGAR